MKFRGVISILLVAFCVAFGYGQTKDNYVMLPDLTGYPRTYDAAAELQMDSIKQLLEAIDPTTSDFKVFETGVYRLNEYFADGAGILDKIKASFVADNPNQRNYLILVKFVDSNTDFATVKVIANLKINSTCYDTTAFAKDLGDYFSLVDIDPANFEKSIVGNLEYLKFKVNKIGCCISNLQGGRVGSNRSVLFGNCDAVDPVENSRKSLALRQVFNNLACKNAITTTAANVLYNCFKNVLDEQNYRFKPFKGQSSLEKIGDKYFFAVILEPGSQHVEGKVPIVETEFLDGKSINIYTFIWKVGFDFWVIKTSNPDLNFGSIYTKDEVNKLFEPNQTFTLAQSNMLMLELKCKVKDIISDVQCDPYKFLNFVENVLKPYTIVPLHLDTTTTVLANIETTQYSKLKIVDLAFSFLSEACATEVYKVLKKDDCLFQKFLTETKSKKFDFLNWYETQISKDKNISQESIPEILVSIASEDFWPRFSKLSLVECDTAICKVRLKQLLYEEYISSISADGTETLISQKTYEEKWKTYGFAQPIYVPYMTPVGLSETAYVMPAGYLCHLESKFWEQRSITTIRVGLEIGVSIYFAGPRLIYGVSKLKDYISVGAGLISTFSNLGKIAVSASDCVGDEQLCKDLTSFFTALEVLSSAVQLGVDVGPALFNAIRSAQKVAANTKFLNLPKEKQDLVNSLSGLKAAKTHIDASDLDNLTQATSTIRSNGDRAFNSVKSLVNSGKAIVLAPTKGSLLAQKVDAYIAANKAKDYKLQGIIGEEITTIIAKEANPNGFITNGKVNNSDNGFDVLSFAPNKDNPTSLTIFESKPLNGNSVVLDGTSNGPQMGRPWIENNINLMIRHSDQELVNLGRKMDNLLKNGQVTKYVISVDKELKQVVIIKLDF